jgi:hypothetical protein
LQYEPAAHTGHCGGRQKPQVREAHAPPLQTQFAWLAHAEAFKPAQAEPSSQVVDGAQLWQALPFQ